MLPKLYLQYKQPFPTIVLQDNVFLRLSFQTYTHLHAHTHAVNSSTIDIMHLLAGYYLPPPLPSLSLSLPFSSSLFLSLSSSSPPLSPPTVYMLLSVCVCVCIIVGCFFLLKLYSNHKLLSCVVFTTLLRHMSLIRLK